MCLNKDPNLLMAQPTLHRTLNYHQMPQIWVNNTLWPHGWKT